MKLWFIALAANVVLAACSGMHMGPGGPYHGYMAVPPSDFGDDDSGY